jgi:hypothetical protein
MIKARLLTSSSNIRRVFVPWRMMSTEGRPTSTQEAQMSAPTKPEEIATEQSESGKKTSSAPIRKRIVIFGGNGYVGQGVVMQAIKKGIDITSISRSGKPKKFHEPQSASGHVQWAKGDIMNPSSYQDILKDATAVVSCVGAFGTNEVSQSYNSTVTNLI